MGIGVSSFYYKAKNKERGMAADRLIVEEIEKIELLLPESGYRPVTDILKRDMTINHKKVQRIMRENGLQCRKTAAFKHVTTDSRHKLKKYPNLLKDTEITEINQAVVGDITAYDANGKNEYLATLMDFHSRRVIGRAISDRIDTQLVLAALDEAKKIRGSLLGCIHHTDSDSRYCSDLYINALKSEGMKISMCTANVYENAHAESLNKTIKRQEINVSDYQGKIDSAISIFNFLDRYNDFRPHSALRGMSPIMYENYLVNMRK